MNDFREAALSGDFDWREIPGFPDYLVHETGDIYDRARDRPVSQYWVRSGFQVNLRTDESVSGQTSVKVARIVASTFVDQGSPRNDTIVFLDGDRANHSCENLAWRTRPLAIKYHREIREVDIWANSLPVIDEDGEIYENILEAAVQWGVCPSSIRNSCASYSKAVDLGHARYWLSAGYDSPAFAMYTDDFRGDFIS